MSSSRVAIFSSCAGYGTYTPALALQKDLSAVGTETELFVFESFFGEERKAQFLTYRSQFHKDFKFAKAAAGIASNTLHDATTPFLNEACIKAKAFQKYIVLYGLWLPALLELGIDKGQIVCLQMDVGEAPSWRAVKELSAACENIWMLGKDGEKPNYRFGNAEAKTKRNALVIHGGGWGITNYAAVLKKLRRDYELHVIYSALDECSKKYYSYYTPISWLPEKEKPDYPPLNRFSDNQKVDFNELCSASAAIISKPGGGTCADALRLHTPLVYLEGMAKHEEINAAHFSALGYACSFKEWEATGFSAEKLERMREKIAADMAGVPLISHHLK